MNTGRANSISARIVTAAICLLLLGGVGHSQGSEPQDRFQVRGVTGWAGFGDDVINHSVIGVASDVRLVAGLRSGLEVLYHMGPAQDRDVSLMTALSC